MVNDLLRTVNKDLTTVACTDVEKVRFAAHLLEGPTTGKIAIGGIVFRGVHKFLYATAT
jgi:hypothetical protein